MTDILFRIETSALGQLMRDSIWLFPLAEILHFMGLSLLIGSLLVVDFRLLGINLVTGVMFLFSDPFRYYSNFAFRMKMCFIILAGLNALYFALNAHRTARQPGVGDAGTAIKSVAGLSFLFWIGVIICGRMIPYVE